MSYPSISCSVMHVRSSDFSCANAAYKSIFSEECWVSSEAFDAATRLGTSLCAKAVFLGPDDVTAGTAKMKDLATREEVTIGL